jgi:hypothetical protein
MKCGRRSDGEFSKFSMLKGINPSRSFLTTCVIPYGCDGCLGEELQAEDQRGRTGWDRRP